MCPRILEPPHLDSMEIRDVGFGMQAAYSTRKRPVQMLLRRGDRHQGHEPARPCRPHGSRMKFVEPSPFNDWRGACAALLPTTLILGGLDVAAAPARLSRAPAAIEARPAKRRTR